MRFLKLSSQVKLEQILNCISYVLFFVYLMQFNEMRNKHLTLLDFQEDNRFLFNLTFSACVTESFTSTLLSNPSYVTQNNAFTLLFNRLTINQEWIPEVNFYFRMKNRFCIKLKPPLDQLRLGEKLAIQTSPEFQFEIVLYVHDEAFNMTENSYYFTPRECCNIYFVLIEYQFVEPNTGRCWQRLPYEPAILGQIDIDRLNQSFQSLNSDLERQANQRLLPNQHEHIRISSCRQLLIWGQNKPPNYIFCLNHFTIQRPITVYSQYEALDGKLFAIYVISIFSTFFALNLLQIANVVRRIVSCRATTGRQSILRRLTKKRCESCFKMITFMFGVWFAWLQVADVFVELMQRQIVTKLEFSNQFEFERFQLTICYPGLANSLPHKEIRNRSDAIEIMEAHRRKWADFLGSTVMFVRHNFVCFPIDLNANRSEQAFDLLSKSRSKLHLWKEMRNYDQGLRMYLTYAGTIHFDEQAQVYSNNKFRVTEVDRSAVVGRCLHYRSIGYKNRQHCIDLCSQNRQLGHNRPPYEPIFTLMYEPNNFHIFRQFSFKFSFEIPSRQRTNIVRDEICWQRCAQLDCKHIRCDHERVANLQILGRSRYELIADPILYKQTLHYKHETMEVVILVISVFNFCFGSSGVTLLRVMPLRTAPFLKVTFKRCIYACFVVHAAGVLWYASRPSIAYEVQIKMNGKFRLSPVLLCHSFMFNSENKTVREWSYEFKSSFLRSYPPIIFLNSSGQYEPLDLIAGHSDIVIELEARRTAMCAILKHQHLFDINQKEKVVFRDQAGALTLPIHFDTIYERTMSFVHVKYTEIHINQEAIHCIRYDWFASKIDAINRLSVNRLGFLLGLVPITDKWFDYEYKIYELDSSRHKSYLKTMESEYLSIKNQPQPAPHCNEHLTQPFYFGKDLNIFDKRVSKDKMQLFLPVYIILIRYFWHPNVWHTLALLLTLMAIWLDLALIDVVHSIKGYGFQAVALLKR
jgi:hypothetical protein